MRVAFRTFGCKANQYDSEKMRQEMEARGWAHSDTGDDADLWIVNSCTVTNQADAQARAFVRKLGRERLGARIVVVGCSAALRASEYRAMPEVAGVVEGHDPVAVAEAGCRAIREEGGRSPVHGAASPSGGPLLERREAGTRGWLKIQDGCDRKCSFCATRLARGASRSRAPDEVVAEARLLARHHSELVLTGIHIGHYGLDLDPRLTLSRLVERLLGGVPGVRFRLGSIEATEVDDRLLDLLVGSGGRLAPHLHMPLQSGADAVLRRMRRWHTREMYRSRALEIAERVAAVRDGALGLGADIITGFPGESDEDHAETRALVEELPFTYLHVFPFSPRSGTAAAELNEATPVPQRVAGERARELREIGAGKGEAYLAARAGGRARVTLEGGGRKALTGDYLRLPVTGAVPVPGAHAGSRPGLHAAELVEVAGRLSAVVGGGD